MEIMKKRSCSVILELAKRKKVVIVNIDNMLDCAYG